MSDVRSPRVGNDFIVADRRPRIVNDVVAPSKPAVVPQLQLVPAAAAAVAFEAPSISMGTQLRSGWHRFVTFLHRHSLVIFAVMIVAVTGGGLQVSAGYWAAHLADTTQTTIDQQTALIASNKQYQQQKMAQATAAFKTNLQNILAQKIVITNGGNTVTIDSSTIQGWLTVDQQKAKISVNQAAISSGLPAILAPLATPVIDQVTTDHGGTTAPTMIIAGKDGTSITNTTDLAQQIGSQLLAGAGMNLTAQLQTVAFQNVTPAAFPKLLEADVNTKKLYAYENGQLVQTFLASTGKPSTPTPLGEFHIWSQVKVQTMKGPGYVQPNVPWISYFDHSGDAIHGVYWRPASVFGSVNTSHGCVGLQVDDAKWVYDWAAIGTTVITHG